MRCGKVKTCICSIIKLYCWFLILGSYARGCEILPTYKFSHVKFLPLSAFWKDPIQSCRHASIIVSSSHNFFVFKFSVWIVQWPFTTSMGDLCDRIELHRKFWVYRILNVFPYKLKNLWKSDFWSILVKFSIFAYVLLKLSYFEVRTCSLWNHRLDVCSYFGMYGKRRPIAILWYQ